MQKKRIVPLKHDARGHTISTTAPLPLSLLVKVMSLCYGQTIVNFKRFLQLRKRSGVCVYWMHWEELTQWIASWKGLWGQAVGREGNQNQDSQHKYIQCCQECAQIQLISWANHQDNSSINRCWSCAGKGHRIGWIPIKRMEFFVCVEVWENAEKGSLNINRPRRMWRKWPIDCTSSIVS